MLFDCLAMKTGSVPSRADRFAFTKCPTDQSSPSLPEAWSIRSKILESTCRETQNRACNLAIGIGQACVARSWPYFHNVGAIRSGSLRHELCVRDAYILYSRRIRLHVSTELRKLVRKPDASDQPDAMRTANTIPSNGGVEVVELEEIWIELPEAPSRQDRWIELACRASTR